MLLDHIGAVFPEYTPELFRWIGRISFPIYAFMIAQGCLYTKNINKYLLRLGIFALISEIPFDIAFMHYRTIDRIVHLNINFLRYTNVFYTLFLGVSCIVIYEKLKGKKHQWLALLMVFSLPAILLINFIPDSFPIPPINIAAIAMCLYTAATLCLCNFLPDAENRAEITFTKKIIPFLAALPLLMTAVLFKTDYDKFGVGLIFLLYLAKPENKITRTIILVAGLIYHYGLDLISTSGDFIDGVFVVTERTINQHGLMNLLFSLIAVVLILFYNGKQGPKFKWLFYVFYPAHITVLAVIWLVFASL